MTKLVNRILFINNRRTSMRLCLREWDAINEICKKENISRNNLVQTLESNNQSGLGLTYFTRLFVLTYFREIAHTPQSKSSKSTANAANVLRIISELIPKKNI